MFGANEPPAFLVAIAEATVPVAAAPLSEEDRRDAIAAAARFGFEQIRAMTAGLRLRAWAGLAGFRLHAWVRHARPFTSLEAEQQRRLVDIWSYGRLTLPRQLFRMLRSVILLAYFEHPAIARLASGGSHPLERYVAASHRLAEARFGAPPL